MAPGPFDSRVKRSRCTACSASHLKCDNGHPCSHCQRRGSPCVYQPVARNTIKLDQGRHKTQASFPNKPNRAVVHRGQCSNVQPQPRASLASGPTARYFYYFEIFVQRNIFAPNVAPYNHDIQRLLGTGSGQFLYHAVLALGALQSSRVGAESRANRKQYEYAALEAYSTSLTALRDTMANCSSPPRLLVFWTTLFLGIFELMHGETGDGWLMHMVHGTASALQAAGPLACQTGLGLSFFLQARIFEASRALLLGERSFLSNPEWDRFTKTLPSIDGLLQRSRLDGILNVIVQCSKLRAQTVHMLSRAESSQVSQVPIDAPSIAKEGFRLRQVLEAWRTEYPMPHPQASPIPCTPSLFGGTLEDLISNIFFSAISIYLSGIFDYEILYWQRWGILVPTIAEIEVQEHLRDLLSLTSVALYETSLSPLLFLFPLRIAGARCCETWQMDCVQLFLTRISRDFAVAGVFRAEVDAIWRQKRQEGCFIV